MRTTSLDYRNKHKLMIKALGSNKSGLPCSIPKRVIGKNCKTSRTVSSDYTQPKPSIRRAGFKDCIQNVDGKKQLGEFKKNHCIK